MKKLLNVVLAFVLLLALASAAGAQESLVVRDESEYASMTMDELYQAALKEAAEGKTLVVYSETGSVGKSVAQFMEDYRAFLLKARNTRPTSLRKRSRLNIRAILLWM